MYRWFETDIAFFKSIFILQKSWEHFVRQMLATNSHHFPAFFCVRQESVMEASSWSSSVEWCWPLQTFMQIENSDMLRLIDSVLQVKIAGLSCFRMSKVWEASATFWGQYSGKRLHCICFVKILLHNVACDSVCNIWYQACNGCRKCAYIYTYTH